MTDTLPARCGKFNGAFPWRSVPLNCCLELSVWIARDFTGKWRQFLIASHTKIAAISDVFRPIKVENLGQESMQVGSQLIILALSGMSKIDPLPNDESSPQLHLQSKTSRCDCCGVLHGGCYVASRLFQPGTKPLSNLLHSRCPQSPGEYRPG